MKRADLGPQQCCHDGGRVQRFGQVAPERADVSARPATNVEHEFWVLIFDHFDRMNRDRSRRQFHFATLRQIVRTFAADGGPPRISAVAAISRRSAVRQRSRSRPARDAAGRAGRCISPSMSSVGLERPSKKVARYRFGCALHVFDQTRCRADANHQHAGRQRVERAGVPRPARPHQAFDYVHHLARRPSGGLVDVHDPAERHRVWSCVGHARVLRSWDWEHPLVRATRRTIERMLRNRIVRRNVDCLCSNVEGNRSGLPRR